MKRANLSPILVAPVARQPQDAASAGSGVDASNSPWDPRFITSADACDWE